MPAADREAPFIKVIELRLLQGPGASSAVVNLYRQSCGINLPNSSSSTRRIRTVDATFGCEIRMNIQLVDFSAR